MELKDLEKMTVTKLREMVREYEDVKGASAMTKDQIIDVLCEKLGIERHVRKVDRTVDKTALKKKVKELKALRAQALTSGDKIAAKRLLRQIHHTKRRIRRAVVSIS